MKLSTLIVSLLGLFLFIACTNQPSAAADRDVQPEQPKQVAQQDTLKPEIDNQDVPPVPAKATALLDAKEIARLYELEQAPSITEVPLADKQARGVQFTWNNGSDGLIFLLQGFNPALQRTGGFKRTLDFLEHKGEPRTPDIKDTVLVNYIVKEGVGDQALWSEDDRILKWRIGESYFGTLMRNPHKSTTEEQDRLLMQQMAVSITARLKRAN